MFKKWHSDKSKSNKHESEADSSVQKKTTNSNNGIFKANSGSPGSGIKDTGKPIHIDLDVIYGKKGYDESKDYAITNSKVPNMPYGDGSDKVFGMENFGYTCYIASILQSLFYTEPLRREILSFPHRNSEEPRRRKQFVAGENPHGFMAALKSEEAKLNEMGSSESEEQDIDEKTQNSSKMRNIFKRGDKDGKNSNSSEDTNHSKNPLLETEKLINMESSKRTEEPKENLSLEDKKTKKYPAYKGLQIPYFLNHQSNLTIVGTTNDAMDTSEQRKRLALLKGPIINLDTSFSTEYNMEPSLFTCVKDAFESITENSSKTGILSAYYFLEMVKQQNENFRGSMHQDAHEFLNFLVNNLIEAANGYTSLHPNEGNGIDKIFEGLLTSETRCLSCESVSTRDEKFLDLSIDLQQNTSLTNCMKNFSRSEMLTGSNKFFCETCHSLQEASKSIKLKKLPQILAFHLKRFKYSEELGRMIKLFYRVEYTKTLRVFNTTDDATEPDKLYELYSVVVHIGGGPYHGHYVALIKTEKYGWLLFDDETVESIDENFVYRFFGDGPGMSTAYLLFYREIKDENAYYQRKLFNGLDDDQDGENNGMDTDSEQSNTKGENDGKDSKKKKLGFGFMKRN